MTVPGNLLSLLTLHLLPGLGPVRIQALLEHFGSAEQALQATEEALSQVPQLGAKLAQSLIAARSTVDARAEWERAQRAGVRLVVKDTPEYPALLRQISDPPHLLYLRGSLTAADSRAVALVGSRRCTDYGRRMAHRLASGLARAGVTVVSGLARGVDSLSHRAALQAGGRTLAVMAGGLSRIYPPEHKGLAEEVIQAGALLTESSMQQDSLPGLFPARNRLISGLCQAVVIVEAPQKSGALITASHAAEQGRSVLAVPGPADAGSSTGCHDLIRKGAVLCQGVEDILEELEGVGSLMIEQPDATPSLPVAQPGAEPAPSRTPPAGLNEMQLRVWSFLEGGSRHLDDMVQQLEISVAQLTGMLLMLEVKKVVRRLPGNRYERC
jgi:DNA processing protein